MQFHKKNILSSIFMSVLLILCSIIKGHPPIKQNAKINDNSYITLNGATATDTNIRVNKHSAKIAAISSAIIPGLGQVYNRKYWKIPIIWGAGIALYTYYDFNNSYYHRFKIAEEQLGPEGEGTIIDPDLQKMPLSQIKRNKDSFHSNKTSALLYAGLLYAANIIDAMVDAHLLDYDIKEDLTLHWEPTIIPVNYSNYTASSIGVKFQLKF